MLTLANPTAEISSGSLPDNVLRRLLDEIDYGLLLLNAEGRVLLANRAARLECAEAKGLRIVADRLLPVNPGDSTVLASALGASARGRRSMLELGEREHKVAVAVVPLGGSGADTCTLLLLGRRQLCETLSVELFARHHGLTGAECHVLAALCEGLAPAAIADRFGVALNTVRTQVASVRSKTASPSIRNLVQRVAALPPIVPALRDVLAP